MKTRLVWRLIPSYLLILVLTTVALMAVSARAIRHYQAERMRSEMLTTARLMAARLALAPAPWDTLPIGAICREASTAVPYRLTVVDTSGAVLGESHADADTMENHLGRPEIRQAFREGIGEYRRYSPTLGYDMFYMAVPVTRDGEVVAVARAGMHAAAFGDPSQQLPGRLAISAGAIALIAIVVSLLVARGILTPLVRVVAGVRALAAGDLSGRLPEFPIREFDALSVAVNGMAHDLAERMDTVTRQRDDQEALIACMAEAVLAVDQERRVLILNRAAEALFGVREGAARGQPIETVVRNADLHRLVRILLDHQGQVEGEIYIPADERYLQVNGRLLRGPRNGPRGAVLVMNDVTRLRKLETMRRDFVANVSHELKTPITSIKGFAETLIDGGHDEATLRRFLERIARQADRLHALIEDILALSRVEYAHEHGEIALDTGPLTPVLQNAARACETAAAARGTRLEVVADPELTARINAPLLEQAVVNLVDNAIKYGGDGQTVMIRALRNGEGCRIQVEDQGPGIPQMHWNRLFERFYRVDQSRNRAQGGTGLGLAIVKHVALAHGGQVQVRSESGQGSVFTILLP